MDQVRAQRLLKKYDIKFPRTAILKNEKELSKVNLKFPLVLKVDSPKIIHKSDKGLVFTGLRNKEEVKDAMRAASKKIKGNYNFVLQETVRGVEVIIGMKRDETFGPVILFGLGGVMVEVMKDVSMRIAPLKKKDCLAMMNEIKGKKLLKGYRNMPKASKEKITDLMLKLSRLSLKENVAEVDFNPVIVNEKEALVVDARFINA